MRMAIGKFMMEDGGIMQINNAKNTCMFPRKIVCIKQNDRMEGYDYEVQLLGCPESVWITEQEFDRLLTRFESVEKVLFRIDEHNYVNVDYLAAIIASPEGMTDYNWVYLDNGSCFVISDDECNTLLKNIKYIKESGEYDIKL